MELAEAWIKEKDKVPTQIMQVGGCAFRDAQKLVRFHKKGLRVETVQDFFDQVWHQTTNYEQFCQTSQNS